MRKDQIYAHRGVWVKHPENTASAFIAALQSGYSIETDMQRTADDDIVIIHDSSTKRATGIDLKIAHSTVAELKLLNFGSAEKKEQILTLTELLEILQKYGREGQRIALQMKSFEQGTASIIAKQLVAFDQQHPQFGLFGRIFVFDVTKQAAIELKAGAPTLLLSFSLGEDRHFPDPRYPTIFTRAQLEEEEHCNIIWGDEWESSLYTKELLDHYHAKQQQFIAISPELHGSTDPAHPYAGKVAQLRHMWKDLIAWGVEGICTDYTEELSEMLEE